MKTHPILEVNDLECFYGDLQVIRKVSFRVLNGDVVALFGPNRHGKSTLLKTICGIHPQRTGSIHFQGKDITLTTVEQRVAMGLVYIPEDKNLFLDMSVLENLSMGAFNRRARKSIATSLDFVFSLFPRLAERKNQPALTLSGGEARMLAIGRGMMSQALLLMIDEPSIGLSPLLKKSVFEAIEEIRRNSETSILVVEQEVDYPLKLANRIYLLGRGRIVLEKQAHEIDKAQIEKAYF
ncbi:MAG: ABC transporter ATP-binding protein [bacterium]|nr:ABC transporter ATP-binding protein [bacterium]